MVPFVLWSFNTLKSFIFWMWIEKKVNLLAFFDIYYKRTATSIIFNILKPVLSYIKFSYETFTTKGKSSKKYKFLGYLFITIIVLRIIPDTFSQKSIFSLKLSSTHIIFQTSPGLLSENRDLITDLRRPRSLPLPVSTNGMMSAFLETYYSIKYTTDSPG